MFSNLSNVNPYATQYGGRSTPLNPTASTAPSNQIKEKSQNQVYNALRMTQAAFLEQLIGFEKIMQKAVQFEKKELTQELEHEREEIKKLNNFDGTQIQQTKKQILELKRKSNLMRRKTVEFQEVIVGIAAHEGMLEGNAGSIERENEIYRNANETKRLIYEIQKDIFDIEAEANNGVVDGGAKDAKYDISLLKDFEEALAAVANDVFEVKKKLKKEHAILTRRCDEKRAYSPQTGLARNQTQRRGQSDSKRNYY